MWCCIVWWLVLDLLKDSSCASWPVQWTHYVPSKHKEPFTQWHNITSQNTGTLNYATVKACVVSDRHLTAWAVVWPEFHVNSIKKFYIVFTVHLDNIRQLNQQTHFISYLCSLTLHMFRLQHSHHQQFKVTFTLTFTVPFGITTYTPQCMSIPFIHPYQWMLKWTRPWTPDDGSVAAETCVGLMDITKK
jgi:hypothetical protein